MTVKILASDLTTNTSERDHGPKQTKEEVKRLHREILFRFRREALLSQL